jgi:phospholipid/cholesterol/gamma-HCH transport system permease protein
VSGDAGAIRVPASRPVAPPATVFSDAMWRSVLAQAAGMVLLTGAALRAALTPPFTWRREFAIQGSEIVRRITIPLCLSIFAFGFGVIGVQAGLVLHALGSADRNGGIAVTGTVREVGAWLTAMVVGGVGGTAICADLGARKTRDELDALAVIGVDAIRTLVTPRILAMLVFTPMLFLFAVVSCIVSAMLGTAVLHGVSFGSFAATMAANFTVVELVAALVKTAFFGLTIGVVACFKGLAASGGPEGVGRAVNQAVVITFVVLWVFNYAFTSVLLANFPELVGLR